MQLAIIIISIILSGFFSGSETAIISANITRLEVLMKKKSPGARLAYQFIVHPEHFLVTLLIGNNISNVVYSSLLALYLHEQFSDYLIVFFSTSILLIFGEILPKTIFREVADRSILVITWLIQPFYWLVYPITRLFEKLTHLLTIFFKIQPETEQHLFSRGDLRRFFRQVSRQGLIEAEKSKLIDNILQLEDIRIRDIMIPRIETTILSKDSSIAAAQDYFMRTKLSRILVYGENPEEIIGQIHVKDIFTNPESIMDILRDVMIVPEARLAYDMLIDFKKTKTGIAVVIDEYGSFSGLISVEDILEELFGDIEDEHDSDLPLFRKISNESYLVNGRLEIDDAREILQINLPTGEYDTIGGLISTQLGKIPGQKMSLIVGDWRITVLKASKKRIHWLKFVKLPQKLDN
ncbi:HlyC/CorC family transporter [candidate division KSB1 bacterium]|nr:HlyC/CorC family transporter [candidate division KSB1 bacterium]